jgi:hypothetical protein
VRLAASWAHRLTDASKGGSGVQGVTGGSRANSNGHPPYRPRPYLWFTSMWMLKEFALSLHISPNSFLVITVRQ